ncbi:hypothetical protein H4W79_003675 [Nocardiopsis terrae]|uniref:Uncharacterized protein n=1 Tax=Nocardiopsis terrae TaxID=372655 RepID=A0ABR9HKF8_9ACTN|nr:hypothetical protein [Nocardiopsis terrae]
MIRLPSSKRSPADRTPGAATAPSADDTGGPAHAE